MQGGLGRVHLPLSTVTVPWLHFICMYYLQGVGSPRLPLHVPISSITHNQVGPGTRITRHQNLQSRVVWRKWNAEGWELSFPCIWVTLDNFCLFLNYILFFSITLKVSFYSLLDSFPSVEGKDFPPVISDALKVICIFSLTGFRISCLFPSSTILLQ